MLAPLTKGEAAVMLSADHELFNPPPNACTGGPSRVLPWTTTLHGAAPAPHTEGSLTETTLLLAESARRSAAQPAGAGSTVHPAPIDGSVVMSTMRKRSLVIGCPKLFVMRRRNVSVPNVLFCGTPGAVFRTRFGIASSGTVESNLEIT